MAKLTFEPLHRSLTFLKGFEKKIHYTAKYLQLQQLTNIYIQIKKLIHDRLCCYPKLN